MKLADETLLSAYLDDELGDDERRWVENALREDPSLARRLAEFRRVRDLVANLPRHPAAEDLALKVVVAIDRQRQYSRLMKTTAGLAVAAGLVLAFMPPRFFRDPDPSGDGPVIVGTNRPPEMGPPDETNPPIEGPGPAAITHAPVLTAGPARDRLLKLDGQTARRLILPVARLDNATVATIEREVRDLARLHPEYVKVALGADQDVDTEHPGASVVFALEVHPEELEPLLARLSNSPVLKGTIRADQPGRGTVGALARAQRPELAEGKRGAPVRTEKIGPELRDLLLFLKVPNPNGRSAPQPETPRPGPEEAPNDTPAGPTTVLIWLGADTVDADATAK